MFIIKSRYVFLVLVTLGFMNGIDAMSKSLLRFASTQKGNRWVTQTEELKKIFSSSELSDASCRTVLRNSLKEGYRPNYILLSDAGEVNDSTLYSERMAKFIKAGLIKPQDILNDYPLKMTLIKPQNISEDYPLEYFGARQLLNKPQKAILEALRETDEQCFDKAGFTSRVIDMIGAEILVARHMESIFAHDIQDSCVSAESIKDRWPMLKDSLINIHILNSLLRTIKSHSSK